MSRVRVLVIGDRGDDHPGFVGERLIELGAELVALDRDQVPSAPSGAADLVYVLGSARSGHAESERQVVEQESAFLRAAVGAGIPLLGICYGAQIMAKALGGEIVAAAHGEVGLFGLESFDAELCPPGPWAQFHSDAFTLPPGGRLLGTSSAGPQGFSWQGDRGRALAWQFHPEVVPEELERWLADSYDYAVEHGADVEAFTTGAYALRVPLRDRARRLTDFALDWLGVPR